MGTEKSINAYKLEICCNSPASAIAAQAGGASRIEFCQNLEMGGTTPSYGQIKLVREKLDIGVHVLIRPRAGDFLYSSIEIEEMKHDIGMCEDLGCDGVVFGVLDSEGNVEKHRLAELVEAAGNMTVVFHRAFDLCRDPFQALEDIIQSGSQRILTSGQQNTAQEGQYLLRELITAADRRIEIMPGSGVDEHNIVEILQNTKATSIHSSAKEFFKSAMKYRSTNVGGMDEPVWRSTKEKVETLVNRLNRIK